MGRVPGRGSCRLHGSKLGEGSGGAGPRFRVVGPARPLICHRYTLHPVLTRRSQDSGDGPPTRVLSAQLGPPLGRSPAPEPCSSPLMPWGHQGRPPPDDTALPLARMGGEGCVAVCGFASREGARVAPRRALRWRRSWGGGGGGPRAPQRDAAAPGVGGGRGGPHGGRSRGKPPSHLRCASQTPPQLVPHPTAAQVQGRASTPPCGAVRS